jgi:exonuclease III
MISYNSSLQDFVYSKQIDIVFLTETWLSNKLFDAEILRQDYNIFRVDRKCETGDGVLTATKESSFTETKQVCFNQLHTELEIVCVERATNNARILVVCCYRAPDFSSKWLLSFKKFLDCFMDTYEKIII